MRREREEAAAGSWGKRHGRKEGERGFGRRNINGEDRTAVSACGRVCVRRSAARRLRVATASAAREISISSAGVRTLQRALPSSTGFPDRSWEDGEEREKKIRELGKPVAEKTAGRSKRRWLLRSAPTPNPREPSPGVRGFSLRAHAFLRVWARLRVVGRCAALGRAQATHAMVGAGSILLLRGKRFSELQGAASEYG